MENIVKNIECFGILCSLMVQCSFKSGDGHTFRQAEQEYECYRRNQDVLDFQNYSEPPRGI